MDTENMDILTGENLPIYDVNMDLIYWSVLSYSITGDEVKGVDGGYNYFSQL